MMDSATILAAINGICKNLKPAPHILIVEDEVPLRDIFNAWFEQICYRVSACGTADAAIQILSLTNAIDVIWLDLILPGKNGLEVLKWVQENKKHIPVIIVTGANDAATEKLCVELGVKAVVQKPKDLMELKTIAEMFRP